MGRGTPSLEFSRSSTSAHVRSSIEHGAARQGRLEEDADPLDPAARIAAQLDPLGALGAAAAPGPHAPVAVSAPASLEELFPLLVRRVAWSGDGRSGAVRLEIGAGALAGATLLVQAEAGRVRVHLELPAGEAAGAWRARIEASLAAKGIPLDAIEVT